MAPPGGSCVIISRTQSSSRPSGNAVTKESSPRSSKSQAPKTPSNPFTAFAILVYLKRSSFCVGIPCSLKRANGATRKSFTQSGTDLGSLHVVYVSPSQGTYGVFSGNFIMLRSAAIVSNPTKPRYPEIRHSQNLPAPAPIQARQI